MKIIKVRDHEFNVDVIIKKGNKKIYIRVKNGILKITTPNKLSNHQITDIINSHYNTLIKYIQEYNKIESKLHYLGNEYELVIKQSLTDFIYFQDNKIIVEVSSNDESLIIKLINTLYINALKKVVEIYAPKIQNDFGVMHDVKFEYKNVKSYFGECWINKKKIILATRLAKYDIKYIVSVIAHEFAHFKFANHQKEFYNHLEKHFPDYKKINKELRSFKYKDLY